jgi:hypothetical protein
MTNITDFEIEERVWKAIKKTINKFRENPYYFFTESDIVTYMCQSLYCTRLEVPRCNDPRKVYLVHQEYPTNFRYIKEDLLLPNYKTLPLDGSERGKRGNYDLVVLKPEFAANSELTFRDIVNKHIYDLKERKPIDDELLFAIEFKYIINSSINFKDEIEKDNKKLEFARKHGNSIHAVNLVFCNTNPKHIDKFTQSLEYPNMNITTVFIQSYFEKNIKKILTPVFCKGIDKSKII